MEYVRILSRVVYQFEQRVFVSGFALCPRLQFFPEGIPAAGNELRDVAMPA